MAAARRPPSSEPAKVQFFVRWRPPGVIQEGSSQHHQGIAESTEADGLSPHNVERLLRYTISYLALAHPP